MKKLFFYIVIAFFVYACNKKSDKNTEVKGNIEGLKSGTLYLQRLVDTTLVAFDTIKIDGDAHFVSNFDLKSPEMLYLYLDRGTTNSVDNNIMFFAEPGVINIETTLDQFYSDAKITGSKINDKYNEFKKISRQFNEKVLELTQSKFIAAKIKNQKRLDSIQNEQDNIMRRRYLYVVNFAINNNDSEIAPYITLAEIYNVNFKYLDTIKKSLTPKVLNSLYGKKFMAFYNDRAKSESK